MKPNTKNARFLSLVVLLSLLGRSLSFLAGAEPSPPLVVTQSHFARLGTNKIHYVIEGHGKETILFVHGWACNADFWREQIPAFTDKARVLALDLPGHGQSDKPERSYTMDFFADAVLAVLHDAHVSRATLVGHSMGTPIICRVYAQAPEKVAGLVAVDGMLRRPKMDPVRAERFVAPFRTPDYRNQTTQFVQAMFPNPNTTSLRDGVLVEMLATPQYVMSSAMDGMFDPRQPAWDLTKAEVPVLVVNTTNPMWTADYQAYVRGLSSQTDYRTIDGAGHFLMLEKSKEFNAALEEMLQKFRLISD
jgi:pimeloyl-ACP methyl ester carboxylesterase